MTNSLTKFRHTRCSLRTIHNYFAQEVFLNCDNWWWNWQVLRGRQQNWTNPEKIIFRNHLKLINIWKETKIWAFRKDYLFGLIWSLKSPHLKLFQLWNAKIPTKIFETFRIKCSYVNRKITSEPAQKIPLNTRKKLNSRHM